MKILFNRRNILEAVSPLLCAVSTKDTLASIKGILIEAKVPDTCTLTTFDLEKGVQITVHTPVEEGGSFIVNAQKFNQTLKVMDGEQVSLTVDDSLTATIEAGKSNHKMNALRGSDFPEIPHLPEDRGFVMKQGVLKKMLAKVMFSMGVNDQRPVLNGCFFKVADQNLLLVSCDSYRMAKCSISTEMENMNTQGSPMNFSFILPHETVNELFRMLRDEEEEDIRLCMTRRTIMMTMGDLIFFSRLIDGEYIEYDAFIMKNHKIMVDVDRVSLLSALERAAVVTEERTAKALRSWVKLSAEGNVLKISSNSTEGSTYEELDVNHEGGDILIAFNNRYLIETLRACTADRVTLEMSSAYNSINIRPTEQKEEEAELFMILPVRMKDSD